MLLRRAPEARFWPKVDKSGPGGCWLWLASVRPNGYGQFDCRLAHRISWVLSNGPIPDGLCVLHRCDVRPCVNPDHLFLGTIADNNRDRQQKGRSRNGVVLGEASPNAKLRARDVRSIRARYTGKRGQLTFLAREFGIGKTQVLRVVRRQSWSHL